MNNKVEEKVLEKIKSTQVILADCGFGVIPITAEITKLASGVSGSAVLAKNHIRLSSDYLAEFEDQILSRTVPHEVCHIYVARYFKTAKQFHGPEFRALMYLVGADSSTRHAMHLKNDTSNRRKVKRFVYLTEKTKMIVRLTTSQHKKAQMGAAWLFKGERIVYDNKMVTI